MIISGIATAGNFNFLYKEGTNGTEKVVNCSFEMAGDQASGAQIRDYYPQGVYIHCNTYVASSSGPGCSKLTTSLKF